MKSKLTIITGIAILLMAFNVNAQTEKNKDQEFSKVQNIIESKNYLFKAERMLPASGISKLLISEYTLSIKGTKTKANLPYYGRAYNAEYGGNGGIKFDSELTNYEFKINEKKRKIKINFKVKGKNDFYKCYLTVTRGGSATLSVQSQNKQTINYWGDVEKLQPEEKK